MTKATIATLRIERAEIKNLVQFATLGDARTKGYAIERLRTLATDGKPQTRQLAKLALSNIAS